MIKLCYMTKDVNTSLKLGHGYKNIEVMDVVGR
jgi:hypothetical protein